MRKAAEEDAYVQQVNLQAMTNHEGPYSVRNGLCFYKQRVVVSQATCSQLLNEFITTKWLDILEY